jgi:hypothetical protein
MANHFDTNCLNDSFHVGHLSLELLYFMDKLHVSAGNQFPISSRNFSIHHPERHVTRLTTTNIRGSTVLDYPIIFKPRCINTSSM